MNCFVCFTTNNMPSFKLGIVEGIDYNIVMSPGSIVDGVLRVRECDDDLFWNVSMSVDSCFLVASSMICIFECHQNRGYESIPQRVFLHHLNYQHGRVGGRLIFSRMSRRHILT